RAHADAAVRDEGDEPERSEPAERLADRRARDVELLGQLFLAEDGPPRALSGDDRLLDHERYVVGLRAVEAHAPSVRPTSRLLVVVVALAEVGAGAPREPGGAGRLGGRQLGLLLLRRDQRLAHLNSSSVESFVGGQGQEVLELLGERDRGEELLRLVAGIHELDLLSDAPPVDAALAHT